MVGSGAPTLSPVSRVAQSSHTLTTERAVTAAGGTAPAGSRTAGVSAGAASPSASAGAASRAANAPASPSGPNKAAVRKSEILFGSFGVEAGVLGVISGPAPPAIRAWTADVNSRGGLGGHPVRVIMVDDGGDPARAQAGVRQMVEKDHVIGFLYPYAIGTLVPVLPYLEEKGIPVLGQMGAETLADFRFHDDSKTVIGAENQLSEHRQAAIDGNPRLLRLPSPLQIPSRLTRASPTSRS